MERQKQHATATHQELQDKVLAAQQELQVQATAAEKKLQAQIEATEKELQAQAAAAEKELQELKAELLEVQREGQHLAEQKAALKVKFFPALIKFVLCSCFCNDELPL